MISRCLISVLGLCVAASVTDARQDTASSLKTIMQELRNDSVMIIDAILVDDFPTIAEAAGRIADHPRIPPEQVALVAAELDSEMAVFKQFDTQVHDLSISLREAAEAGDLIRVQQTFQDMMAGCFGCHAAYRQRVMSALAGEN